MERCINQLGMKDGILEPGVGAQPVPYDDPSLVSIYDLCSQIQIPVFLRTGPWAGQSVAYTPPSSIERVAQQFLHLPIVVAHACWPYFSQSITLVIRQGNVCLSPDIYVFHGG
jgi:predicted TIM-barrel fold metal-dependent hydrolase